MRRAFHEEAGTDFSTLILLFSRAPVVETRFLIEGKAVGSVAYEEVKRVGDWFYGPYKYGQYEGSRLGHFVDFVVQRYQHGNTLTPEVDADSRMLVAAKHTPKKVRRCVSKCLYMSRFDPGSSHVRCAPISSKFDGAGTTNEYFILRVKDQNDLPWIWYVLNGSDFVQDYMNDMARGMAQKRVKDNEFLAMPFRRPDAHIQKEAKECFSKALAMRKERRLLKECFRRARDVMRLTP